MKLTQLWFENPHLFCVECLCVRACTPACMCKVVKSPCNASLRKYSFTCSTKPSNIVVEIKTVRAHCACTGSELHENHLLKFCAGTQKIFGRQSGVLPMKTLALFDFWNPVNCTSSLTASLTFHQDYACGRRGNRCDGRSSCRSRKQRCSSACNSIEKSSIWGFPPCTLGEWRPWDGPSPIANEFGTTKSRLEFVETQLSKGCASVAAREPHACMHPEIPSGCLEFGACRLPRFENRTFSENPRQ